MCSSFEQKDSSVPVVEQGAGGFSLMRHTLSSVPLLGGHGRKVGVNGQVLVKVTDGEGLLQASGGSSPLCECPGATEDMNAACHLVAT